MEEVANQLFPFVGRIESRQGAVSPALHDVVNGLASEQLALDQSVEQPASHVVIPPTPVVDHHGGRTARPQDAVDLLEHLARV